MALVNLKIQPGIYKEASDLAVGRDGKWVDGNLVRFFKGQPQPIGGWNAVTTSGTLEGKCRGLYDWTDLQDFQNAAIGTHLRLYIYQGGTITNVTPLDESGQLTNPFSTTNLSDIVSVADTAHNRQEGDYVIFANATAVGGITIDGTYNVVSVTDANTYTIQHSSAATSTAGPGGGTVDFEYELSIGGDSGSLALGWGAGGWGEETWGTARSTSGLFIDPRTWSFTNFGEDLMACPKGGTIYKWDASAGGRATTVSNAPSQVNYVIMSPRDRHLIALGAHDGSAFDPLFIRWASQNDSTAWTPSETNTAGDARLDVGSEIVGGLRMANNQILVFTDEALYAMEFLQNSDLVFRTRLLGTNCGLVSPNAALTYSNVAWYMGHDDFFVYDGRIHVLPCDVRSYVFDDFNVDQRAKVYGGINEQWQEAWWFYASADSTDIDRYVTYNWTDNTWSIGDLARTAWRDASELFRAPYAVGSDSVLYVHEDPNSAPNNCYIESGMIEVGEGNDFLFIDKVIPDFERLTDNKVTSWTFKSKRYPAASVLQTKGPYSVSASTEKFNLRLRGRQFSVKIESDDTVWRLSAIRVNINPDGNR